MPGKYRKLFQLIDYDYVVATASAARAAGVPNFSVISSPGADPSAKFSFLRIKGEVERDVGALGFSRFVIFRPYHLMKPANEVDTGLTKIRKNLIAWFARSLPGKHKAILVEDVAEAMKVEFERSVGQEGESVAVVECDALHTLLASSK